MSSIIFKRRNRKFILKCNSKRFNNFENYRLVYEKTDLISKTIKEYYSRETFPTIHWKTCFRRWADEGISSFSLHPGLVCTEIFDKADFTSYKESDHSINLHNLQTFLYFLQCCGSVTFKCESAPLTNRSGSNSGSDSFLQWLLRWKKLFSFHNFFL